MTVENREDWERRNEEYRKQSRRRSNTKTGFEKMVAYAWNTCGAKPSVTLRFENMIPSWQNGLVKFARRLLALAEEESEDT